MNAFFKALQVQRWDDHRYYHHSRINQSLHFVSAASFLAAYVLVFTNPVAAALTGWLVSMTTRQAGHFFFEPKGYDVVNQASHEHKEEIKVGYNLRRKLVLIGIWAVAPLTLLVDPALFGMFEPAANNAELIDQVSLIWLGVGIFIKGVMAGLVWMTKILTDPFHDLKLYCTAPIHLLRGELIDPMGHEQSV